MVRAYKIRHDAAPWVPWAIIASGKLQEGAIEESNLRIPKLSSTIPPVGDAAHWPEAAKLLVNAEKFSVIVAGRMGALAEMG